MSNSAARLIALSIIILTGGLIFSFASIARAMNSNRGQEAELAGLVILLSSGISFGIEYFATLRRPGGNGSK